MTCVFVTACEKEKKNDDSIIDYLKVIPENISTSDSVLFVTFVSPSTFCGDCTYQSNVDSIIDTRIYISGKYDSNCKCEVWDKGVNDTINIGLFSAGKYELIYTLIDVNQYGAMYPTEKYIIKFVVTP